MLFMFFGRYRPDLDSLVTGDKTGFNIIPPQFQLMSEISQS